jgi:hypothetical protein
MAQTTEYGTVMPVKWLSLTKIYTIWIRLRTTRLCIFQNEKGGAGTYPFRVNGYKRDRRVEECV